MRNALEQDIRSAASLVNIEDLVVQANKDKDIKAMTLLALQANRIDSQKAFVSIGQSISQDK